MLSQFSKLRPARTGLYQQLLSGRRSSLGNDPCKYRAYSVSRPPGSALQKPSLENYASRSPKGGRIPGLEGSDRHKFMTGSNLLIFGGGVIWALILANQFFHRRQRDCFARTQQELYQEFGELDVLTEKHKDTPPLFYCVVRVKNRELQDIFEVEVGDVLEVLEEGVGKQGTLNLCRSRPRDPNEKPTVCPYPMGCLQRLKVEAS